MKTHENLNIFAAASATGLVGLAIAGLKTLDLRIALGILDKIQTCRAALSFGVRIDGERTEIVAHVLEGADSMHLVTLQVPTPTVDSMG